MLTLTETLKRHEGYSSDVYEDTNRVSTVGYGHAVKSGEDFSKGVSEPEALKLLQQDIAIAQTDVKALFKNFEQFPTDKQEALTNMAFNLGRTKLGKFKDMGAELSKDAPDWGIVADAAKDSIWYTDVKGRGVEIVQSLRGDTTPTFEEMRQTQKSDTPTFAQMRYKQAAESWRPPTPEEEAIQEDWVPSAAIAVGGAAAILGGPIVGVATGTAALGGEAISAGTAAAVGRTSPELELPVHLATGLLLGFTAEKWFISGCSKAAKMAGRIPNFWSKEFAIAEKKGLIAAETLTDHADIIRGMDMGDTKSIDKMRNILKQDAYIEKVAKVSKRLEKMQKVLPQKIYEPIEKVIKKLSKKPLLDERDYQHLSRIAKEDAVREYTSSFAKLRTNIVNRAANAKWQDHRMKDVIEAIKRGGGISPVQKFSSPELAQLLFKRHPDLKVTKAVSANLTRIADDFGYTNIDDMFSEIYHTPNMTMFKRASSAELGAEFRRIYQDEIFVRIAEKEADYLFKLRKVGTGFKEGKLLKQKHIEALHRVSNTLPAKEVLREVTSLKRATTQLLKIIQKPGKDTKKLARLQKVYTERLADYQAAVQVKKELGLINQRLKCVTGVRGEYKDQLDKLLAPLFGRKTPKLDEHMFAFLARKYNDEISIGADILIKKYDGLLKTYPFSKKDFMELTYAQAKDLDEFVKNFQFVAKSEQYITFKAEKVLTKIIAKKINDTAQTTVPKLKLFRPRITGTQLEELAKGELGLIAAARRSPADLMNGALASLKRIEAICYQLDGFKSFGRAWKSIFNKTIMAEAAEAQLGRKVFGRYHNIFEVHAARTGIKASKYWTATGGNLAGHTLNKETALMMALNSKNKDNLKAMLKGLQVTKIELDMFLKQALNKTDNKMVDDILDFFEADIFPITAKVYKQKTGLTFQKATGGRYIPIMADRRYAKVKEIGEDLFQDSTSYHSQRQVKQTYEELRKGGVKAVKLTFRSLTQHIQSVVHSSTHWGPLNEIQRLTRNADFRTAVETTMGKEVYQQFSPWLNNLARPSRTKIDTTMGTARRNVTFASLSFVPKIAVKQSLSFLTAMPKVGYRNSIVGLTQYMRNPLQMAESIKAASPEMFFRAKNWNRDMVELMAEIGTTDKKGILLKYGYAMIHKVDEVTASVTWLGAYRKGLQNFNGNGNIAINYANKVVRATQPASAAKDVPLIMRAGEGWRAVSMFYSYWSVFHGQVAEVISKGLSSHLTPMQITGTLAWLCVAPAVAQQLAATAWNALTGREQEEEQGKELIKGAASNLISGLPVVRDIASSVIKEYPYQVSPVVTSLKAAGATVEAGLKIFDEDAEFGMYDIESASKFVSAMKLIPSKAAITAVNAALRIREGETTDWTEIIDKPAYEKD